VAAGDVNGDGHIDLVAAGKLKAAGVTAKLVVKPGAGHGWADLPKDMELLADWFDRHLKKD
jgi:dipeptidyl aminopeptidase/acylaminoacyl peptidase